MKPFHIAIVGGGIAGLSAAILLDRQGHHVAVFEQSPEPKIEGAGLVLQPAGLAVLKQLGVLEQTVAAGQSLTRFSCKTHDDEPVFELDYRKLHSQLFAVAVPRCYLIRLLLRRIRAADIPLVTGFHAGKIKRTTYDQLNLIGAASRYGHFDLIVDCSGVHSVLREKYAAIKLQHGFDYGVLWSLLKDPGLDVHADTLHQKVQGGRRCIGLFRCGPKPGANNVDQLALHWGVFNDEYPQWISAPLSKWKAEVSALWPELEPVLQQLHSHRELTFGTYRQVVLRRTYNGRLVFLGDAAHAMSPRLGQGANLALVDAACLATCLAEQLDVEAALKQFDHSRRKPLRYYHFASRLMGDLFQSRSRILPPVRNMGLRLASRLPWTHRYMLTTLAGVKTGLFSRLTKPDSDSFPCRLA